MGDYEMENAAMLLAGAARSGSTPTAPRTDEVRRHRNEPQSVSSDVASELLPQLFRETRAKNVQPVRRKRQPYAQQACDSCRRLKVACDNQRPCHQCIRRKKADACTPPLSTDLRDEESPVSFVEKRRNSPSPKEQGSPVQKKVKVVLSRSRRAASAGIVAAAAAAAGKSADVSDDEPEYDDEEYSPHEQGDAKEHKVGHQRSAVPITSTNSNTTGDASSFRPPFAPAYSTMPFPPVMQNPMMPPPQYLMHMQASQSQSLFQPVQSGAAPPVPNPATQAASTGATAAGSIPLQGVNGMYMQPPILSMQQMQQSLMMNPINAAMLHQQVLSAHAVLAGIDNIRAQRVQTALRDLGHPLSGWSVLDDNMTTAASPVGDGQSDKAGGPAPSESAPPALEAQSPVGSAAEDAHVQQSAPSPLEAKSASETSEKIAPSATHSSLLTSVKAGLRKALATSDHARPQETSEQKEADEVEAARDFIAAALNHDVLSVLRLSGVRPVEDAVQPDATVDDAQPTASSQLQEDPSAAATHVRTDDARAADPAEAAAAQKPMDTELTLDDLGLSPVSPAARMMSPAAQLVGTQLYGQKYILQKVFLECVDYPVLVTPMYPSPFTFPVWCNDAFRTLVGCPREEIIMAYSSPQRASAAVGFTTSSVASMYEYIGGLISNRTQEPAHSVRVAHNHLQTGAVSQFDLKIFTQCSGADIIYMVAHFKPVPASSLHPTGETGDESQRAGDTADASGVQSSQEMPLQEGTEQDVQQQIQRQQQLILQLHQLAAFRTQQQMHMQQMHHQMQMQQQQQQQQQQQHPQGLQQSHLQPQSHTQPQLQSFVQLPMGQHAIPALTPEMSRPGMGMPPGTRVGPQMPPRPM